MLVHLLWFVIDVAVLIAVIALIVWVIRLVLGHRR